jgi:hypothetical protein
VKLVTKPDTLPERLALSLNLAPAPLMETRTARAAAH